MHCGKPLKDETEEYCADCRKRKSYITQGKALWLHRDPVPAAVYRFKYKNRRSYGKIFAREMVEQYEKQIGRWQSPGDYSGSAASAQKRRKRGYNQAEILAEEIGVLTGIPVRKDVLFRIRKTVPQKNLDTEGRKKNLQGAFAVSGKWRPVKNVLLVDDIYTTGSTVEHAAKVLRKAGSRKCLFFDHKHWTRYLSI